MRKLVLLLVGLTLMILTTGAKFNCNLGGSDCTVFCFGGN